MQPPPPSSFTETAPGARSSAANSWPSSAATTTRNRTSLSRPSWQSLAWPRAFSSSRGGIPPCWPRRWKAFHQHAAQPGVAAPESVFSGKALNALLDQAEVFKKGVQRQLPFD